MTENDKKRLIDIWEDFDENHPANSYLRGDAEFAGPVRKRKCTDIGFLIVFVIVNLSLVYVSYTVINAGAPERLSYGYDFRSEVCGHGDLKKWPYMYWPDPYTLDFSLCIESCPQFYIRDYYCVYANDHTTMLQDWCWDTIESTTYGFYCIPIFDQARRSVINYLFNSMQTLKRSVGDIILAWDAILIGVILAVVVSFTILMFFRFQYASIGLMTLSIIANEVLLLYLIYLCYRAYQNTYNLLCDSSSSLKPEYCYTDTSDTLLYLLFAISFLVILYPIVILSKVKSIKLSIGIIKLATQPFHTLKQIFFYPLIQLFLGSMILGFLFLVIAYTMSTGIIALITSSNIPGGRAKVIEYSSSETYYMICNVVVSVWWIAFLVAFSEFVLSAAVSVWYFTRERSSLYFPLWRGFKLIIRYHMGSVVRGSFLTIITAVPRFFLSNYISLSALCRKSSPGCTDCMLRTCYCLKCYQKWLRYFTKYSYIFLALFGESYYNAARKSYYLINRNRERIFVPAKAGDFGMLIIKTTITLSGTTLCYSLVTLSSNTPLGQSTSALTAPVFIAAIGFLVSAYVSQIFGGSMQACMDTIIICGACDEEMFTREQRFMYKELQDYLDEIYEEMTEQQKEHKEMAKMKASHKVYQKTRVMDEGETHSVMKPYFNQNSEVSAPVMALNIEDPEEDHVFSRPNIVLNTSNADGSRMGSSFRGGVEGAGRNFLSPSRGLDQRSLFTPNKNPEQKSFLAPSRADKSFVSEGPLNSTTVANRIALMNLNKVTGADLNRSVASNRSQVAPDKASRSFMSRFAEEQKGNFLGPNMSYLDQNRSINRKPEDMNRTYNPGLENASFISQNKSVIDPGKGFLGSGFNSRESSFHDPGKSFGYGGSNDSSIRHEEGSISEEPIQVFEDSSVEVEQNDQFRPSFKR